MLFSKHRILQVSRENCQNHTGFKGAFQIVARFQKIYLPLCKSNNKK